MTTVHQADHIIRSHQVSFGTERVDFILANGRTLAEDLIADRQMPPFDRVTMDGIAIDFAAFELGGRAFTIESVAAAGQPQCTLQKPNNCVEVMTGAVLPLNANTVIRYEDLEIENGTAVLITNAVKAGQNVHKCGSDRAAGQLIAAKGRKITAAEIGLAATLGKALVWVEKTPRVVIISTGNELVAVDQQPLMHQIRNSNGFAIAAALQRAGVEAHNLHLADDERLIETELTRCLAQYDVVLLSGGVSAGKFDFVPAALQKLHVENFIYKVAQRPGKPFWFGRSLGGTYVFALPGNPVSTFMCLTRYVLPWLSQPEATPKFAVLTQDVVFKPELTYFLQVKCTYNADGRTEATPIIGNGSGDTANLTDADAFMELPSTEDVFLAGQAYQIWQYR